MIASMIVGLMLSVMPHQDTDNKKVKADEEFIIEGERLSKLLRGTLSDGLKAFNDGDFELAERKFSALSTRQFKNVRARGAIERQFSLVQGRSLSSVSADRFDQEQTYTTAPNAKALAFGHSIPLHRIQKAASQLFFVKGIAQLRQGKNDEALKSFEQSLEMNEYNLDARIEYALTLMKKGDFEMAGIHIKALDGVAAKHCVDEKCVFLPDSKKRYMQISLAYRNAVDK